MDVEEAFAATRELIGEVVDDIGRDAWHTCVDEVLGHAVPGFIPFTDGGWDGVVTFDFYGEEAWSVDLIRPQIEADWVRMEVEFREDAGLADDVELTNEVEGYEEWREQWERGGDATTWFVKARVLFYGEGHRRSESGLDEMLFCFGINNDFNYGRDSISWCKGVGTTWLWERTVTLADLTPEVLAEIKAAMFEAWREA